MLLCGLVVACSISVMNEKKYVIACPAQWNSTPLLGQDKQVSGYLVDLIQEISKEQKMDIRVQLVPEAEIAPLVERKAVSGYFSAMPRGFRAEREFDMTSSFFTSGFVLIVQKDSPKQSLEECVNMNIGYTQATATYLHSIPKSGIHSSWREYLYETVYAALDDLMKGRLDGVVVDSLDVKTLSLGYYKSSLRPLYPPIFVREIRLVAPKNLDSKIFIDHVEKGLQDLEVRGVPKQLLDYWELFSLTSV